MLLNIQYSGGGWSQFQLSVNINIYLQHILEDLKDVAPAVRK